MPLSCRTRDLEETSFKVWIVLYVQACCGALVASHRILQVAFSQFTNYYSVLSNYLDVSVLLQLRRRITSPALEPMPAL